MHDPMVVAFDIRRPWPQIRKLRENDPRLNRRGISWPFAYVAGRELYWPAVITVWHVEPRGADALTVCDRGRWQWHVHHWRIQVQPLQSLRRRLLTRCAYCHGRSTKRNPTNTSLSWHSTKAPWWRGEVGLYHAACAEQQRQINVREAEIQRAKMALRIAAKQAENEVLVEGSYFQRDELPTILGNYMRAAADLGREAKGASAALEVTRTERDALQAQLDSLTTQWGVVCSHPVGGDWIDVAPDEESARRAVATHSFATTLVRRVGSGPWVEVTD